MFRVSYRLRNSSFSEKKNIHFTSEKDIDYVTSQVRILESLAVGNNDCSIGFK